LIQLKQLQERRTKINCTTCRVIALRIHRHIVTVDDYSLCFINSQLSASRVTPGAVALFNKAQKRVTVKEKRKLLQTYSEYFPNLADQFVICRVSSKFKHQRQERIPSAVLGLVRYIRAFHVSLMNKSYVILWQAIIFNSFLHFLVIKYSKYFTLIKCFGIHE